MAPGTGPTAAARLDDAWPTVVALAAQTLQDQGLTWRDQFGPAGPGSLHQALDRHRTFIVTALELETPHVLERYIRWLLPAMEARSVPPEHVEETLDVLALTVEDVMEPTVAEPVVALLSFATDLVREQGPAAPPDPQPHDGSLVDALLGGDHRTTTVLLADRCEQGRAVMAAADEMVPAAMAEVGRRWQCADISVAEAHLATATLDRALADLYESHRPSTPIRDCVLACVKGNRHEMGLRLAADLLERRRWRTRYLGADVPTRHLVELVGRLRPEVLLLSVAMDSHVPTAYRAMEAVRATMGADAPRMIVGGRPFREGLSTGQGLEGVGTLRVLEELP